jgi:hypothetical protein
MRRAVALALLVASAPALAPPAGGAQAAPHGRRVPRRVVLALVGGGVGAAVGGSYVLFRGQQQPGTCASSRCVMLVMFGAGGLLGYMMGREVDELHAARYRGGVPLHPPGVAAAVAGEPAVVAARGDLVAVDDPVAGTLRQQAPFPRFAGEEPAAPSGAPRLGADTREVLATALGLSDTELDALAADGVI